MAHRCAMDPLSAEEVMEAWAPLFGKSGPIVQFKNHRSLQREYLNLRAETLAMLLL